MKEEGLWKAYGTDKALYPSFYVDGLIATCTCMVAGARDLIFTPLIQAYYSY